ncbi:hypothetical protein Cgig2_006307 [Carnegiea gigantea]|uniref:Uncharacterized protein n=1 Tax=Carnegiea gigantea TaxID=171969 RepID=A0A9Q1QE40_9CARY|nr:hypothetical protein Cgig2_006307 [Carnegiea gigantea]
MEMNLFPNFSSIEQVAEYIRDHFQWALRDPLPPCPRPLLSDYMASALASTLGWQRDDAAKLGHTKAGLGPYGGLFTHAAHIPEMVQAIYYAMVINDVVERRLIRREIGESLMLDLQKLRWDIIEAWLLSIDDKLKDTQVPRLVETMYNPRLHLAVTSRLRDAAPYLAMRSNIKIPLPLYVPLIRGRREEKKKKMVHFSNFTSTEMGVEYVRETFRWLLRETSAQCPRPLPEDHLILCPRFGLGMATQYAQDSNIPEMVQTIFYAMVVNEFENVEHRLGGARTLCLVNPPIDLTSSGNPAKASDK